MLSQTLRAIRTHLWSPPLSSFVPHVYVDASPFPRGFDEGRIRYHGGLAVGALAGVLSTAELRRAHAGLMEDVAAVAARGGDVTVGLTMYPPYPTAKLNASLNIMAEFTYQNGGDWAWFGGRWVQALVQHGLLAEARAALEPMAARVVRHGGFFEWYAFDGSPQGSKTFHGSAGVLGKAIEALLAAEGRYR